MDLDDLKHDIFERKQTIGPLTIEELKCIMDEQAEEFKYDDKFSFTTMQVSSIKSIILGPNCSRFWLFRKHINSMNLKEICEKDGANLPFFAWECLTI
jgi:hypothetical protein